MNRLRIRWAMPLVVAMAAVGLGAVAPGPARASCVGPRLSVVSSALIPGAVTEIHGTEFFDTCDDVQTRTGCSTSGGTGAQHASRGVQLVLMEGSRSWLLGRADADPHSSDYLVRWKVRIPADVPPGPATLIAGIAKLAVVVG